MQYKELHDGLLLVVDVNNGNINDYINEIYDASLLGIRFVRYCFKLISEKNSEQSNNLDFFYEKLNEKCESLNIKSDFSINFIYDSTINESIVIKVNENGFLMDSLEKQCSFKKYKKNKEKEIKKNKILNKILNRFERRNNRNEN